MQRCFTYCNDTMRTTLTRYFASLALCQALIIGVLKAAESSEAFDARTYEIQPVQNFRQKAPAAIQRLIDSLTQQIPKMDRHDQPLVPWSAVQWDVTANRLQGALFVPGVPSPLPPETSPIDIARRFALDNPELTGLTPQALDAMKPIINIKEKDYTAVDFQQSYGGIPFVDLQGFFRVIVGTDGRIQNFGGIYNEDASPPTEPKLSVEQAYSQLRRRLPNLWKTFDGKPSPHDGETGQPSFQVDPRIYPPEDHDEFNRTRILIQHVGMDFTDELTARLRYYLDAGQPRLVWQFNRAGTMAPFEDKVHYRNIEKADVLIDAENGEVLRAEVREPYPAHF